MITASSRLLVALVNIVWDVRTRCSASTVHTFRSCACSLKKLYAISMAAFGGRELGRGAATTSQDIRSALALCCLLWRQCIAVSGRQESGGDEWS
jgi:hypothetical protein